MKTDNLVVTNKVDISGSVGIGTTTPDGSLEINGLSGVPGGANPNLLNLKETASGNGYKIRMGNASTYSWIQSEWNSAYSDLVLNFAGGNVSVGASSASAKLSVDAPNVSNILAFAVNQLDTGSMGAASITSASTGDGLFIDQNGNGIALHIDNDGTANSITVEGTTTTDLCVNKTGELYGSVINNQYSNILSGDLLGMFSTLKFLNTLTGTPATDAANMIDVSGAAHNGTYKGTWAATQRINKGFGWILSPNGTDNYISLGDNNDFSFGDGANDSAFTIAGVIEVVAGTSDQIIVSKYDATTGLELREYVLYFTSEEKLKLLLWDESANVGADRTSDAALAAGNHTYAVTYSGVGGATAANGITIYVDGAVVASTAGNDVSYVAMENLTTEVWIGALKSVAGAAGSFMTGDFTPPTIDKGTVWTAAQVNRFHQYMKGVYNL